MTIWKLGLYGGGGGGGGSSNNQSAAKTRINIIGMINDLYPLDVQHADDSVAYFFFVPLLVYMSCNMHKVYDM